MYSKANALINPFVPNALFLYPLKILIGNGLKFIFSLVKTQ